MALEGGKARRKDGCIRGVWSVGLGGEAEGEGGQRVLCWGSRLLRGYFVFQAGRLESRLQGRHATLWWWSWLG